MNIWKNYCVKIPRRDVTFTIQCNLNAIRGEKEARRAILPSPNSNFYLPLNSRGFSIMQLRPTLLLSGRLFDLSAGRCIKNRVSGKKLVIRCFTICKGSVFPRYTLFASVWKTREEEEEEDTFQAKRRWRKLKGSSFTIWMIIQVFLHSWDLFSLSLFLFGEQFRFSYFETDEWIKYIYICIWFEGNLGRNRLIVGEICKGGWEISMKFLLLNKMLGNVNF